MIQLELAGENALILYLPAQISAGNLSQLQQLQQQLKQQQALPTEIRPASGIFRLLVGPTTDKQQAQRWLSLLKAGSFPSAYFSDSRLCS